LIFSFFIYSEEQLLSGTEYQYTKTNSHRGVKEMEGRKIERREGQKKGEKERERERERETKESLQIRKDI
jgi:hypothetical protein